jgi:protein SCO1/2
MKPGTWNVELGTCLAILALAVAPARAGRFMTGTPEMMPPTPEVLKRAGFDQKLNAQVPLDLTFRDEAGAPVKLSELIHDKPVILNLVYLRCPMLCTEVLNGLLGAIKNVKFNVGDEYEVLTVSFDSRETPELAAAKKKHYLAQYGRAGAEKGWRFLTGEEAPIKALADAVGFRYVYDEKTDQFAHASGLVMLTPEGKVSHYFFGVFFSPAELRMAMVEASQHKIGSPVDAIMLFCFHYDPVAGKYTAAIMNMIRAGGVLTLAALGLFVAGIWRGRSKALRPEPAAGSD